MGEIETTNAEIVWRGCEVFSTADLGTLAELFVENGSRHTPGRSSTASDHMGRDAVFVQFGRYGGQTNGTSRPELLDVMESHDGRVVGVHHGTAERDGRRLNTACCIVFELEDRRVGDGASVLRPSQLGRVLAFDHRGQPPGIFLLPPRNRSVAWSGWRGGRLGDRIVGLGGLRGRWEA